MPGRGPFSRRYGPPSVFVWTSDEDQGLPGAPGADDFMKPMPKRRRPESLDPKEPAALTVALATCVVITATLFDWATPHLSLASSRESAFTQGHWYLIFTAMLSHSDLAHLLSNLLGFVAFGYLLKRSFGLLAFPMIPAICGVLITVLTNMTTPPYQGLIGSSGVVFSMVGLYVTLYYFSENRYSRQIRVLRIVGFVLILFFPHEYSHDISYLAHAYGFGIGVIAALILLPYLPRHSRRQQVLPLDDETPRLSA